MSRLFSPRWALAAAVAAVLASPPGARASFELMLSESGFATQTITDNGAGDTDSRTNHITFAGSYGDFTVDTSVTGFTNTPGTSTLADLQVNSLVIRNTSTSAKTLTVSLSANDYSLPSGSSLMLSSSVGGTFTGTAAGDTFTFASFADSSNTLFGQGTGTTPQSFTSTDHPVKQAFDNTTNTGFSHSGDFSLTNVGTFTVSGGGQVNPSGTTSVSAVVPEPGTVVMSLSGLLLLGARRARRFGRKVRERLLGVA